MIKKLLTITSTIPMPASRHALFIICSFLFACIKIYAFEAPSFLHTSLCGQAVNYQDSIPKKRPAKLANRTAVKIKPSKNVASGRIKMPSILITNKRRVLDSTLAPLRNIGRVNLSWQLTDSGFSNPYAKDTVSNAFVQYLAKYYQLGNFDSVAKRLSNSGITGRFNIAANKVAGIDSVAVATAGESVSDSLADPDWNGTIAIDSSNFNVAALGALYTIDSQKVVLKYPEILLNNFIVKDAAQNQLVANGTIASTPLKSDGMKVNVSAKNFTLLNAQRAIANQLYGFASVNAEATITGSAASPVVTGDITLNDNTDVTIVLPQNNANKDAEMSMVQFIDKDTFSLPAQRVARNVQPFIKAMGSKLLNYNFNVHSSPHAALTFILDPASGDELKLYGEAKLKAAIDSAGELVLNGLYALDSGYYTLNYQFLRKQFKLLPGSTIIFAGAPDKAQVNIKAAYTIKTSPQDLLGNEVGEVDAASAKAFNKSMPFTVLLSLNGPIIKPLINFEIVFDEKDVAINKTLRIAVTNKLKQISGDVAATNKQVFSLLLYERFVGEQSTDFFKGGGTGDGGRFNDLSKESVSKFLSSALDNLASDLFKGLDVNQDPDSYKDFSNGDAQQKTDLKIGNTKSFINDRLSISVGKNYGIDGQDASAKAAQQKGAGFLPDVTLNYKFTKDGKYRYRSYKKNQFEVIVDGFVTESGISLSITLDYDRFKNLFTKKIKKA